MKRIVLIAFALFVFGFAAAAQHKGAAAASASRIAESWIAAWNSHDPEKLLPLYTKDAVYEDVAFGEVSRGPAELRKFAASFMEAVPDLKLELTGSAIQGDHGTIEWVLSGTDKDIFKTGKKFTVRGASVLTLAHGKISRNLDFYDSATIMRQVGVLPAPAAPQN